MLAAIRAMEALTPLPRMFMRTVIQALKGAPRLRVEVGQLLERLVAKQVRLADTAVWPRTPNCLLLALQAAGSFRFSPGGMGGLPLGACVHSAQSCLATHTRVLLATLRSQIWRDKDQWRGLLLCADHMRNDAYGPLLQLPEAILEVGVGQLWLLLSHASRPFAAHPAMPKFGHAPRAFAKAIADVSSTAA